MKYFLGIDQGGTKTIAIICDSSGQIHGVGHELGLETAYHQDTNDIYAKRILSAAEEACKSSGIKLAQISSVCGCLNGADWDFEYPILTEKLKLILSIDDATVVNDSIGAMRGGSSSENCAVVCAGSGLNVAVRRADGAEIIYGYYIDSAYQGGHALGTHTLRKVMDSHLQICGKTRLTELVLSYTGYRSPEDLMIDLTMEKYNLQYKDLAPLLMEAYADDDIEAVKIVNEFVNGISKYVTTAIKRLDMCDVPLDLVLSGSVFKDNGSIVAEAIYNKVADQTPKIRMIHAKLEPVCGAALILLDKEYKGKIPPEVNKDFNKSAERLSLIRSLKTAER